MLGEEPRSCWLTSVIGVLPELRLLCLGIVEQWVCGRAKVVGKSCNGWERSAATRLVTMGGLETAVGGVGIIGLGSARRRSACTAAIKVRAWGLDWGCGRGARIWGGQCWDRVVGGDGRWAGRLTKKEGKRGRAPWVIGEKGSGCCGTTTKTLRTKKKRARPTTGERGGETSSDHDSLNGKRAWQRCASFGSGF